MAGASAGKGRSLLFLLAILIGVVGWNYKRNVDFENAELRPYRSYSDTELEQLIDVYRVEADRHRASYEASKRKVSVRDRGLLGAQIGEFERVQKISSNRRALASNLTDHLTTLSLLVEEHAKRELNHGVYKQIFRRSFTFRPL